MSKNRISGAVLFVFTIFYAISGWHLEKWGHDVPGPGLVPLVLSVCLGILSIIIWFEKDLSAAKSRQTKEFLSKREPTIIALLVFSYTFLMPYLGFPLSGLIFMFAMKRLIGPGLWLSDLSIVIIASVVVYVVFVRILALQVPVLPVWIEG